MNGWLILAVILALCLVIVCVQSTHASIYDPCEACKADWGNDCPCLPEAPEPDPISEEHSYIYYSWLPVVSK